MSDQQALDMLMAQEGRSLSEIASRTGVGFMKLAYSYRGEQDLDTRSVFALALYCWRNNYHDLAEHFIERLAEQLNFERWGEHTNQFLLRLGHTWRPKDGTTTS